jgi:phosphoglycerol transferase MdoB-like AlkP superfamily enzyme
MIERHRNFYFVSIFICYFIFILVFIFITISEIIFWDEFGTRFNFIAVDYLIYSNEIIGTIKESLPLNQIILTLICLAIVILYVIKNYIIKQIYNVKIKNYWILTASLCVFTFALSYFYDSNKYAFNRNQYIVELTKNGNYEFVMAFFSNQLDYYKFYPTINRKKALAIVRKNIETNDNIFVDQNTIARNQYSDKARLKSKSLNIILIIVESLSAEFMQKFGNNKNLTPYLDKLADNGLFFTNLYASGTRTVRGLEAITLSIVPTPGSSIIRRTDNKKLFNIGSVLKKAGYDINFMFGGYSYFDNLQDYFSGNDFNIIDRADLHDDEISFTNIWGVADEDILFRAIKEADQSYKLGKNFLSLIMTTSNHRPYTFPSGRIDILSGTGRSGAVKYTDYAIGQFIEKARSRPWFNDSIFVITADHCASSAGKTTLPIEKYHIPLIIYAPNILKPKIITSLASQIDIGPTILGLLNLEYKSKFFGTDILNNPRLRAFISTYQLLGYMKNEFLVTLAPNEAPKTYRLIGELQQIVPNMEDLTDEAISFYQSAYDFYINGKMKDF